MNVHAIRAIYMFELARTWRTLFESLLAPVLTTSLYFVVFGSAIGLKRISEFFSARLANPRMAVPAMAPISPPPRRPPTRARSTR